MSRAHKEDVAHPRSLVLWKEIILRSLLRILADDDCSYPHTLLSTSQSARDTPGIKKRAGAYSFPFLFSQPDPPIRREKKLSWSLLRPSFPKQKSESNLQCYVVSLDPSLLKEKNETKPKQNKTKTTTTKANKNNPAQQMSKKKRWKVCLPCTLRGDGEVKYIHAHTEYVCVYSVTR